MEHFRSFIHNFFHSCHQKLSHLSGHCANASFHHCRIRNNIKNSSCLHMTNCQCTRFCRITLQRHNFLKSLINLHCSIQRIFCQMWICTVCPCTGNLNSESITGCHCRTIFIEEIPSRRSPRSNVEGQCSVHFWILQNACGNHIFSAFKNFFRRFKHNFYSSFQLLFLLF